MPAQLHTTTLSFDQLERAAASLSHAFASDPMYTYVLPEDATRPTRLARFFRSLLHIGRMQGEVYIAEDGAGAAIWLPPENINVSFWNGARAGMGTLALHWGIGGFTRLLNCANAFDEVHDAEMITKDHWYLLVIGIDPVNQGRGLGSELVQLGTRKADLMGKACYLETCTHRNVVLYERYGFRVTKEDRIERGGPVFWALRRNPQFP